MLIRAQVHAMGEDVNPVNLEDDAGRGFIAVLVVLFLIIVQSYGLAVCLWLLFPLSYIANPCGPLATTRLTRCFVSRLVLYFEVWFALDSF